MSSMPRIKVVPVRGSEWVTSGRLRDFEPEPFTVALETSGPGYWAGIVLDSEFEGCRVNITQSQTGSGAEVEVRIAEPGRDQGISRGSAVFDPPFGQPPE